MSGLIATSKKGKTSGYTGQEVRFKRFTNSAAAETFAIPQGSSIVVIEVIGAGGGGGGGGSNSGANQGPMGGGGGGGGSMTYCAYPTRSLPRTVTVTVGAGGSGGANGVAGGVGGTTSVTNGAVTADNSFFLYAYGGGGG